MNIGVSCKAACLVSILCLWLVPKYLDLFHIMAAVVHPLRGLLSWTACLLHLRLRLQLLRLERELRFFPRTFQTDCPYLPILYLLFLDIEAK